VGSRHGEFRTGAEFDYRFDNLARLGVSFYHVSRRHRQANPGIELATLILDRAARRPKMSQRPSLGLDHCLVAIEVNEHAAVQKPQEPPGMDHLVVRREIRGWIAIIEVGLSGGARAKQR
jgi:hypothetical protein